MTIPMRALRTPASASLSLLAAASLALLGACSGGSSSGSLGAGFQIISCNLGCSLTSCAVSEIAQNQPIEFVFSQAVDSGSVNGATFVLQTATGERPVGQTFVDGNTVRFVPSLSLQGGSSTFGFKRNATYVLSLPGPTASESIRSVSGTPLASTLSCSLTVTKPPIDIDGRPPTGVIESPMDGAINVPPNVTIVVSFSELLDASAFSGVTAATSPVQYRIRKTREQGGQRSCDLNAAPVTLVGVPTLSVRALPAGGFTSVVTMQPTVPIPSLTCVEVEITKRVKDLAGNSAEVKTFRFISQETITPPQPITESFQSETNMDKNYSSGTWANGQAVPGRIGGDGRHGEFNLSDLTVISQGVFQIDTRSIRIPGIRTLSGKDEIITDGVVQYSRFELPEGSTIRVIGDKPLRLYVRGKVEIAGRIQINAPAMQLWPSSSPSGQAGGLGVCGGAAGGRGANKGDGISNKPEFNGANGLDVILPGSHPYVGQSAGTGGKGALQEPSSGRNADVTPHGYAGVFSAQLASGGGGGGFLTAGAEGRATFNASSPPGGLGGPTAGGKEFNLLDQTKYPLPPTNPGTRNLEFFLLGGSGGGGGGSDPHFSQPASANWKVAAGGSGGGGAIALRSGRDIAMTSAGRIECHGGDCPEFGKQQPPSAPGGGGSGGSIVLQQDGSQPGLFGTLSVRGGLGGIVDDKAPIYNVASHGGNGSAGLARLELVTSSPNKDMIGTVVPPATDQNVGILSDSDKLAGAQSRWYASRQFFPPSWLRYEVEALIDNVKVVYSDDPAVGQLAQNGPVNFYIQGARVSPNGEPDSSTIKPWRKYVGQFASDPSIELDDATGFRFQILFDKNLAQDIKVTKVTVYFRG